MTREEAINILNRDDDSMRKGYFCINDFKAIEVLKSEEPILDKIKAEIKDVAFDWQEIDGEHESFMVVDLNDVLQIIDKYKAESEDV